MKLNRTQITFLITWAICLPVFLTIIIGLLLREDYFAASVGSLVLMGLMIDDYYTQWKQWK